MTAQRQIQNMGRAIYERQALINELERQQAADAEHIDSLNAVFDGLHDEREALALALDVAIHQRDEAQEALQRFMVERAKQLAEMDTLCNRLAYALRVAHTMMGNSDDTPLLTEYENYRAERDG